MSGLGSILIADDEETFLRSTARLLSREGYDCDCAADADEALRMLGAGRYDLLIADVKMPGNTDLRLIREVEQLANGTAVILVTGYPSLDSAIQSIRLPISAYLTKPLDFDELLKHVRESMERSRTHQVVLNVCRRLESCLQDLQQVDRAIIQPQENMPPDAIAAALTATLQSLVASVSELRDFRAACLPHEKPLDLCQLLLCPRRATLEGALRDAIQVIEQTRHAFKSKELGELRSRLEQIAENLE